MIGGGVFNFEGQLLGMMVRGIDMEQSPEIKGVVKIYYIKLKMNELYNGLLEPTRIKIRRFINGEIQEHRKY